MFWADLLLTVKAFLLKFIAVSLLVVGVYFIGRNDGAVSCKLRAQTKVLEKVEADAKIDRTINRLDKSDIDRRLSRWVQ